MPTPLSATVDRARRGVDADVNRQVGVVLEQRRISQRFEAQLVARVRGVRDELAQEDLLVRVQGVDHQLEELSSFGLEAQRFPGRFGRSQRGLRDGHRIRSTGTIARGETLAEGVPVSSRTGSADIASTMLSSASTDGRPHGFSGT